MVKLRKRNYKSLKKYCCDVVNESVRVLVLKNHKSKKTLLEEGIDIKDINTNPLLSSSTTTFDFDNKFENIAQGVVPNTSRNISVPSAIHEVNSGYRYNDNYKLYNHKNHTHTYESLPLDDLSSQYQGVKNTVPHSYIPSNLQRTYNTNDSNYSITNPFEDVNKMASKDNLMFARSTYKPNRKQPPIESDPFNDDAALSQNDSFDKSQPLAKRKFSNSSLTDTTYYPPGTIEKQQSTSSLIYDTPVKLEKETLSLTHTNSGNTPYPLRGVSMYDPNPEYEEINDKYYEKSEKASSSSEMEYPIEPTLSTDDDNYSAYDGHH